MSDNFATIAGGGPGGQFPRRRASGVLHQLGGAADLRHRHGAAAGNSAVRAAGLEPVAAEPQPEHHRIPRGERFHQREVEVKYRRL